MDKQTLKDLEIFEAQEEGKSVFSMMDFTITQGGHDVLKNKFSHLLNSQHEITSVQTTVQYFIRTYPVWEKWIRRYNIRDIEKYISTNINPLQPSALLFYRYHAFRYRYHYTYEYYFIQNCIMLLLKWLQSIHQAIKHSPEEMPDMVKQLNNVTIELTNDAVVREIIKQSHNSLHYTTILKLDYSIRVKLRSSVEVLMNSFYEVDALLSMAHAVLKYNLSFPVVTENSRKIFVQGLRHLLLLKSVPNNLEVEQSNFIFITGPNMSGKSTFIKALALLVYLSHIGMGVPATDVCIPFFDDVFAGITVVDNLHKGESYFLSEVLRLKDLAIELQSGKRIFAVLDELFKGTNLKDAMDCCRLTIEKLLLWRSSYFILCSHLTELATQLKEQKEIVYKFFATAKKEGDVVFSYKIGDSISEERLGMYMLYKNDLPSLLTPYVKGRK